MPICQRDVVFIYDDLQTTRGGQQHPYIVLSCEEAINHEDWFTAVMVTDTDNFDDQFSFWLDDAMFTRNWVNPNSQARLHIIGSFKTSHIYGQPVSRMKTVDFRAMLRQINQVVFSIDED